jgi:hypothetical protein
MPAISLEDANKVGLMDRVDTKFYFHERFLPNVLMPIIQYYAVLEIKGERLMPYESAYYDTSSFQMLRWHQNGKLNRYKIRKRRYVLTDETFLEIKFKSNKSKTEKYRRLNGIDYEEDQRFISQRTPFHWLDLHHILNNKFDRMMLINKNMRERVSIDLNVGFSNGDDNYRYLDKLVVLEIKSQRHLGTTELQRSLKNLHILPNSFSKFVTGMYLHYKEQKYNNFKRRFLHLNKTMEKNIV